MKILKAVCICICLVGLTQLVWSQDKKVASTHQKGIPGFLDPQTGEFKARLQSPTESLGALSPTTPPSTGTLGIVLTVTIKSANVPSNAVIACTLNASTFDDTGDIFKSYSDTATGFVLRGSGSTVNCAATIPYSWPLGTPTSDTVSLDWEATIVEAGSVGSVQETFPARTSAQTIGTFPIPTNGSVNILPLNIVL